MRTWIFCTTGKWIAWMARMTKTANSTVGMKLLRSPPIMKTLSTCCLTSWSNDSSASMPFDPRLWSNPSVQSVIFFFSSCSLLKIVETTWAPIDRTFIVGWYKVTKSEDRTPPHFQRRKYWQGPSCCWYLVIVNTIAIVVSFAFFYWVMAYIIWADTFRRPCVCDFLFPLWRCDCAAVRNERDGEEKGGG